MSNFDRKTIGRRIRLQVILLLVSAVLSLPAVLSGWMNDDYFFDTTLYETDAPFGYYDFMERFEESGLHPWWISPDYKLRFIRPLSSLTLHLDFTLFGASPLGAHIHSLLWSLLLLLGGFEVLRCCLKDRRAERFAMVIFALAICHAWGAGWIAARNGVMGGALAVWSAAFYLGWRQGEGARRGVVSLVLFGVGLLAGEVALALVLFALCYELAFTKESWSIRLRHLGPTAGVACIYAVIHKVFGYGAGGSGAYIDPLIYPGDYLAGLIPKTLAVLGAFSFGVPALLRAIPGAAAIPISAGVLGLALLTIGFLLVRARLDPDAKRSLRWLVLAVFLPLLPAMSGLAQGREFVLSAIAFAAVAATILRALFAVRGAWHRRILPWGVAGLMFFGLFVLNPLSRLGQSAFIHKSSEMMVASGKGSQVKCAKGAPVYVLNGDFMRSVGFPFAIARHQGTTFPSWQHLITPESDIRVERAAVDRIVVSSDEKPLINDFLQLYRRADDRFTVGDVIDEEYLRAEIQALSDEGPTRVAFTIPGLAREGGACLLRYEDEVLRTWKPPRVGETAVIEFVPPM